MSNEISTFHHLGISTRDMAAAVRQYERLGFMFTPMSIPKIPLKPGGPPEALGVANRCAIFQNNYLEMLGVIDATRWASITSEQRGPFDIDKLLQRYQGLHVMHFSTDDLDAVRSRLEKDCLHPSEIRPFQRPVDTPDGTKMMRARSLSFPPDANPEALVQIAQHETRELVLQPRFMGHPNGALSISESIVCVEDLDRVAAKYSAYTAHSVRQTGHLRIIDLGLARIVVVHPKHLEDVMPGHVAPTVPFLAGFTITANLVAAADVLNHQGVGFQEYGGRILIRARDACGSAVLFESPNAQR